jgi:four helix bundle protein
MSTIKQFEDLEAWKEAREFARLAYGVTALGSFTRDFVLRDQLRRAAVSISSNIAEGFERSGDGEFIQFLSIAKGSCGECRSLLHLAHDQRYLSENEFFELVHRVQGTGRLIAGLIKYLRNSEVRGLKYRKQAPFNPILQECIPLPHDLQLPTLEGQETRD